ncbi:MAG: choice-of-anchor V domain-containing protein, partial [Longimicrobiales bacterium]
WRTLAALPLVLTLVVAARANVAGPPPAHTGGFGEKTCHECHFDGPLDAPSGEVTIEGVPFVYEPGHTYTLHIRVRDARLKRAGFELAARYAAGPDAGVQAGELHIAPGIGATTIANDVIYAHHVASGTTPDSAGEHGWDIEWTAPADARADVALHVAANAANDDDSELGDRIHTGSVVVPHAVK